MAKEGIRLDTGGSSEMEVLEFYLRGQSFGVPVLKIEAIEQFDPKLITTLPMAPPEVAGTLLFRNRTVPLIDLAERLGVRLDKRRSAQSNLSQAEQRVFLIIEFNDTTVAFIADGVHRIHRIQLPDVSQLSADIFGADCDQFLGSVSIENHEVLIVDMERLVGEINPAAVTDVGEAQTSVDAENPHFDQRQNVRIILAEDSGTMRKLIKSTLAKGNYTNVTTFKNGQTALEAIKGLKERAERDGTTVGAPGTLVITDIEMPQMDGLTMCRNIKQQLGLADLPVVVFSTLSSEKMNTQARDAGADDWISKPQITKLVEIVDELTIARQAPTPANA